MPIFAEKRADASCTPSRFTPKLLACRLQSRHHEKNHAFHSLRRSSGSGDRRALRRDCGRAASAAEAARVAGAAGARRFTRPHRPGGSAAVTAGGRDRAPGPESHVDQGVLASYGPGVGLERRSLVRAAAPPRSLGRRPLSEGAGRHSLQPWTLVARAPHLQLIRAAGSSLRFTSSSERELGEVFSPKIRSGLPLVAAPFR